MSNPARFLGSRAVLAPGGALVEAVVRIGDLEARAVAPQGEALDLWTVRSLRRGWTREQVSLADMRASRQMLPAVAKACSRLVRAA